VLSGLALDLGWVAGATGGRLARGDAKRVVGAVTTDSRTAKAGDLFVALRGPRFDAHDFAADVLSRGAAGVVVGRTSSPAMNAEMLAGDGGVVAVGDTLQALQDLAHAVRLWSGTKVIAITGSAGKTTTKEAIAECLSSRYRVVRNKGNLNNHIGLPLSLIELRSAPDVAVMELGMNHAGEIGRLVAIAEPDVRVWTNVGDAHIGFFASADAIADAKSEILERATAGTLLVSNADDPRVVARVGSFPGRRVTFGTSEEATVRASEIEDRGLDGMRAKVSTPAGDRVMTTPLLGRGNLSNVLAAVAVSVELGVGLEDVVARVATLAPAARRGAVRTLKHGIRLIDDSYNSSPAALRRALDVLAHDRSGGRRVAVLGEMLELGEHAIELHRQCGGAVAAAGIARLFVIGGESARALGQAAVDAGLPAAAVSAFADSQSAVSVVVNEIGQGDTVLVKGSRGIQTDVVADRIAAEWA
jgi:UDP-N-acetylmuramoyl-tripeptide--D-alanyl-D-alanine ligase